MKVSIGILAHNEAARIEHTLRELFAQDIFESDTKIEVVCVPNGCTDETAAIASRVLAECVADIENSYRVKIEVRAVAQSGKSRTWNRFVHEFSDQTADAVLLLDADIRLPQRQCLSLVLDRLFSTSEAWACVDVPRKDIAFEASKAMGSRLSLAASEQRLARKPAIAGSLYCVRGHVIRQIWLPEDLLVEDGFIKAMIVTEFFTRDGADERLQREDGAFHIFAAERSVRSIFRHQLRLMLGTAVNAILYNHLWSIGRQCHAGEYVRDRNASDPTWTSCLISAWVTSHWLWPISSQILFNPLCELTRMTPGFIVRHAPATFARLLFDIPVFFVANWRLRQRRFEW